MSSPNQTAAQERADMLAYLARKRKNAETMAKTSAEFSDQGRWTARQIAVLDDDLRTGMHLGEAELARERSAALVEPS